MEFIINKFLNAKGFNLRVIHAAHSLNGTLVLLICCLSVPNPNFQQKQKRPIFDFCHAANIFAAQQRFIFSWDINTFDLLGDHISFGSVFS